MRVWSCIWFACCAFAMPVAAGTPAKVPIADSTDVVLRRFDNNALDRLRKDPNFQYGQEVVPVANWWERLKAWFWNLVERLFATEGSMRLINWVFIVLGAAALVFLVMRLMGMDGAFIFSRRSKKADLAYSADDDIHAIDFEDSLRAALEATDYRLAVRLLYLRSLKVLSDRNLIHWQPGKTNAAYVAELRDDALQDGFSGLTRQFEYVWYGDFKIDGGVFDGISDRFTQFNQRLS